MKERKNDPEVAHANQASIIDLAAAEGIELKKISSDCFKVAEHDSLVITPSRNAWFWNSHEKGGFGALSFAKDYILRNDSNLSEKAKFVKALKIVSQHDLPEAEYSKKATFSKNGYTKRNFNQSELNLSKKFDKVYSYLSTVRGISPKLIQQLHNHKLLSQDTSNNAVFIKRHPMSNKVIGASLQGTTIDHNKFGKRGTFKGIAKNSMHNSAWAFDLCKNGQLPHKIMFFEAPIDAMSYCTLQACKGNDVRDTRYVALDGLKKKTVLNYIAITQYQLGKKNERLDKVELAVDNDEAGNNFVKKMQEYQLGAMNELHTPKSDQEPYDFGKDIERELNNTDQQNQVFATAPKFESMQPSVNYGKDWNDALRASNSKIHQKAPLTSTIGVKKTNQTQSTFTRLQNTPELNQGLEL